MPQPRHLTAPFALVLAFLGLCCLASFPYFEATRNANELPRLVQGMALVDTGHWAIDGPARRGIDLGPDIARSPVDGRVYPNKPPGTTLVAALAYRVARVVHGDELTLRAYTWWARLLTGVLPTLLLAGLALRRLVRWFEPAIVIAAVVLWVLATPAFAYAHLAYGHALAAVLLVPGAVLMHDATRAPPDDRGRLAHAAVGGALAASAVVVEYGTVFAGVPVGAMLLARARSRGGLTVAAAALAGAAVPMVLLAGYHAAVFGSPWATGYHNVVDPTFAAKHGQGLLGLGLPTWKAARTHLWDPATGLLWWAPLLPFGVWGLVRVARTAPQAGPRGASEAGPIPGCRGLARLGLAILFLYIVILLGLSFEGGWRIGPRYAVAILPVFALGFCGACSRLGEAGGRRGLAVGSWVALASYGLVVNVLAGNLWPHVDPTNIAHPVPEVLVPLFEADREPYGLLAWLFGVRATRAIIAGSVVGALAWVTHPLPRTGRGRSVVALGVCLGVLGVFATTRWPQAPNGRRNLAYIERVWEPPPGGFERPASRRLPPLTAEQAAARPTHRR